MRKRWVALGLCAGCAPAPIQVRAPAITPIRTAATHADVSMLLARYAEVELCKRLEARFIGFSTDPDSPKGAEAGVAPLSGRWWIRSCAVTRRGAQITVILGGPGWAWVDQSESGYAIRQYINFSAQTAIGGEFGLGYEPSAGVASIWFTAKSARAGASHLSKIDAKPISLAAHIIDILPWGAGYADDTADKKVDPRLVRTLEAGLGAGVTLTYDVGRGQLDVLAQHLPAGVVPSRPHNSTERFVLSERQELHDRGLQVAGPFEPNVGAIVEFTIESGSGISYRTECKTDVEYFFASTESRGAFHIPLTSRWPSGEVRGPQRASHLVSLPCRWYLITTGLGDSTTIRVNVRESSLLGPPSM